jgi:TolB-like protein/DNA-binding winged helix-turn-helix (wHTH) protein
LADQEPALAIEKTGNAFRFGAFEVNGKTGELRKHGIRIKLQQKPFEILLVLLEQSGELVSRDQLRPRLWPASTFVDFDQSLNTAMRRLRRALGDSAGMPRFIETHPRRGYRFLAPVQVIGQAMPPSTDHAEHRAGIPSFMKRLRWIFAPAAVLCSVWLGMAVRPEDRPELARPVKVHSVAVLPFVNLARDAEQDYFADGLSDALIGNLAQASDLRVTSRTSTAQFKNSRERLPEIARVLGVEAIVEGTVQRSGDRIRITSQLIEAASDRHLWAGTFESDTKDILALESEVAAAVAEKVELHIR